MSKWVQCTVYISKIILAEVRDEEDNPEQKGFQIATKHFANNHDDIENVQIIVDCDVERSKQLADEVILLTNEVTSS